MSTRQQRTLPTPNRKRLYLYVALGIVIVGAIIAVGRLSMVSTIPAAATDVSKPAVLTVGQVARNSSSRRPTARST